MLFNSSPSLSDSTFSCFIHYNFKQNSIYLHNIFPNCLLSTLSVASLISFVLSFPHILVIHYTCVICRTYFDIAGEKKRREILFSSIENTLAGKTMGTLVVFSLFF